MASSTKFIPGSDAPAEEIFTYPFFIHEETKEFIKNHGKIMFIIRGPPGTEKWSLTQLMMSHFSTAVKYSAVEFFKQSFSATASHACCYKRVRYACKRSSHPVIVSKTNVKKEEMQAYLNLAAMYEYTVIISSTLDKFEVTPEILAKTNTGNLDKKYFEKRLKAWEDVFPICMGWFLCPDDSFYLLHELQCAINALLGDGQFCRVFNEFDRNTFLNNYKAKTLLFCMAGFMKRSPSELKEYYESAQVRESYGKCFIITVQAFVVTEFSIFAVVQLDDDLKDLTFKSNFETVSDAEEDDVDSIVGTMQRVSLEASYKFNLVPLTSVFSKKPKSAVSKERDANHLNVNNSSFIHLAQRGEKTFSICELNKLYRKSFMGINGEIPEDEFNAVDGDYRICRLKNDGWVIQIPKNLSIKTVFTGLYI